jgi:outer membrane protein
MNRRALFFLLASQCWAGTFSIPGYLRSRLHPDIIQERDVEGINDRVRDGKLELTLKDFLALLLKNSTDIRLTQLDVYTAADAVTAAKSPFDPQLLTSFNSTRTVQSASSQTSGAATLNSLIQTSQASYNQVVGAGPTVSASFSASRLSSNSAFSFFNPSIATNLNLQVTQPLLRGRGNLQFRIPLQIARTQLRIVSDLSMTRIADSISVAAGQYWDTIRLRDNIRVTQESFNLAQKSYDHDKLALELGALSKLDILTSQSQLAQRKLDVIQSQYAYREALDGVRRLIGADLKLETRNIEIVLLDDPSSLAGAAALQPLEEALAKAMRDRPEMSAAQKRISVDEMNARVSRDSLLPRLDLSIAGGGSGLGGNQLPVVLPLGATTGSFVTGGAGDSLQQLFSFNSPYYGVGVTLGIPVRSSAAKASLADALVNRTRDRYTQRQIEQQIILEVKTATNERELAKASVDAAIASRDLARQNVDAEQQKYELGTITAFELLDAQSRLAVAESSLVNAYVGYQKSLISYQRATWTILDELGAVVTVPKEP